MKDPDAIPWPLCCIILAGGFGTRLKHILHDIPKPLAPIHGVPFLDFLLQDLARKGIKEVILATGYQSQMIERRYGANIFGLNISYSVENTPLGTGGAVRTAMAYARTEHVLVLNGDTYCSLDLKAFSTLAQNSMKPVHLALTYLTKADRYGLVQMNADGEIVSFAEKQPGTSGLINVGTYCLDKKYFLEHAPHGAFSLEQDFFSHLPAKKLIKGHEFNDYFIDIGVPADYERAYRELPITKPKQKIVSTLFLDRDGVINQYRPDDYVKTIAEFKFRRGVLSALKLLGSKFDFIFIITNQQGVGKRLMSEQDLEIIHRHMLKKINQHGGRIDRIFTCTSLKDIHDYNRKPNPGMLLQAQLEFPEIDLRQAVMVGDSYSDIEMGQRLGLKTVWIQHQRKDAKQVAALKPDVVATSLWAWAKN